MSGTITHIPVELIGINSSELPKVISYENLERILLTISLPTTEDERERFNELIRSILTSTFNLDDIPELMELLFIPNAVREVIKLYSATMVKDPILSITGRYFVVADDNKDIVRNDHTRNHFSFINVTYTNRTQAEIIDSPFIQYNNNISIEINDSKFVTYLQTYMTAVYDKINTYFIFGYDQLVFNILKKLYLYAAKQYIETNSINYYSPYNSSLYYEGEENYSKIGRAHV